MRKIVRLFAPVLMVLICVALFRASVGADKLSLTASLNELRKFEFDFSHVQEFVDFFKGDLAAGFVGWDSSLGFFENMGNVLSSFFSMIGNIIRLFVVGIWNIVTQFFAVLGAGFNFVFYILGLRSIPS